MGHLFVVHGDLRKLACDALVIPCDEKKNVNRAWESILPAGLNGGDLPGWIRIGGMPNGNGVIDLPPAGNRMVRAFVAPWDGYVDPCEPVETLWTALVDISERLEAASFRPRPLIGIPLVGTGHGGLASRRAEVVAELLRRQRADPLVADLALVLFDRRDFAAVQNQRHPDIDWPDLDGSLHSTAEDLGRLAAQKQLSLFLGAGVSRPAGLPDWPGLLELLADKAGVQCPSLEDGFENAASYIRAKLGDEYEPTMRRLLDVELHAVGHALLAGLRVHQMVTTNFDPCMELALEAIKGERFRVLVRELAEGGKSWLLKLHGDIRLPKSLILDREDVVRHKEEGAPLRGVVQSLLLTSHLLFVGFSFKDEDFLDLAESVSSLRASARCGTSKPVGTALALTDADADSMRSQDLKTVTMLSSRPDEAARMLEIFLDRLAWAGATNHERSAEYLLDDRYGSGLSDRDRTLRDLLMEMSDKANANARLSSGWSRVASCLRDLGADLNS